MWLSKRTIFKMTDVKMQDNSIDRDLDIFISLYGGNRIQRTADPEEGDELRRCQEMMEFSRCGKEARAINSHCIKRRREVDISEAKRRIAGKMNSPTSH